MSDVAKMAVISGSVLAAAQPINTFTLLIGSGAVCGAMLAIAISVQCTRGLGRALIASLILAPIMFFVFGAITWVAAALGWFSP